MTSFKRGYNVILRSCFRPKSQHLKWALTTFVNAQVEKRCVSVLISLNVRLIETLGQNADPKRTIHGSNVECFASRRRRCLGPKKPCVGIARNVEFRLLFATPVHRTGVYMTSFRTWIIIPDFAFMLPPDWQHIFSNFVRNGTFQRAL